jgi:RNA polymerase sigma-70 factor (ECF subfamily)
LGIAANVCRRWARSAGRELARTTTLILPDEEVNPDGWNEPIADQGDALDTELEYAERAQLLNRALGLLPPDTREALIGRYLLELPLGEIAARHGLSEATLSVRLHRGKRALRQLLMTTLQEEALEYGLLPLTDAGWQATRIWCPRCGATRLQGQLGGSPTRLRLRCPSCAQSRRGVVDQDNFIDHPSYQGSLDGINGFKAALNRVGMWADSYYRTGANAHGAHRHADIAGIALSTAEARRFWRTYPRIHLLPHQEVERDGRDVIVVRYEAVDGAQLDTLFVRDNSELLSIHQTPGS